MEFDGYSSPLTANQASPASLAIPTASPPRQTASPLHWVDELPTAAWSGRLQPPSSSSAGGHGGLLMIHYSDLACPFQFFSSLAASSYPAACGDILGAASTTAAIPTAKRWCVARD
ncbi:Os10g0116550 [Oryza sativa Japonica Group]|uniref:Os10g0116550 protein n=1 Tax=Oryza sativa subsp. japonica TaxID=39947 RepID=A0A0P0XR67_ORYSJ|nr:Os10g0116550 [Oryza sativa Japonica Group]